MRVYKNLRYLTIFIIALIAHNEAVIARNSTTISDDWQIFSVIDGSGDKAKSISLPHCWSLNPDTPQYLTEVNYIKTLYAPESWRGKRIFLKFGGVNNIADLLVNSISVGEHRGGATAFAFEITKQIRYNEDNIVMMRVTSSTQNDILPTSVEHELYGGIYRDVELIITPEVAISPTYYGSDGVFVTTQSISDKAIKGDVKVKFIAPQPVERDITLSITDKNGNEVFNRKFSKYKINGSQLFSLPFSLNNATAWSPENPVLYDVSVAIDSVDDKHSSINAVSQYDEVSVRTGFRTITLANDGSTKETIRINGKPILMRGVSLYHDHPIAGGVLSEKGYRRDLGIINDMGANAIRSAITPHDNTLYGLCDEAGLMVWVDTPFAKSPYLSDLGYFPTSRFRKNSIQQLTEIIYQNYNHPSVMMWGLFSLLSSKGNDVIELLTTLKDKAKEIDPTRPIVALSNQNGDINMVSDLIVWLQNLGWDNGQLSDVTVWSNQLHSRWSHLRSGVMYGEGGSVDHKMDRSEIAMCRIQKRDNWYPEVRQSAQHESYAADLNTDSLFWGLWATSMFDYRAPRRSTGMSYNGLVSFDRNTPKDAYYLYRALWNSDEQTLHIADKRARMVGEDSVQTTLRVYSSSEEAPMASINGEKPIEMQRIAPSQYILDKVAIIDTTNVVVTCGELRDSVELIYGSPLRNRKR